MAKLNLKISNTALEDLDATAEFIAKDKENAAVKMLQLLHGAFNTLCEYPDMGVKRPDLTSKDVLFYIVKKRYFIVYTTQGENLRVLRVLTTHQDIGSLL
jgi:plasmid stabilization system protein ParE